MDKYYFSDHHKWIPPPSLSASPTRGEEKEGICSLSSRAPLITRNPNSDLRMRRRYHPYSIGIQQPTFKSAKLGLDELQSLINSERGNASDKPIHVIITENG